MNRRVVIAINWLTWIAFAGMFTACLWKYSLAEFAQIALLLLVLVVLAVIICLGLDVMRGRLMKQAEPRGFEVIVQPTETAKKTEVTEG